MKKFQILLILIWIVLLIFTIRAFSEMGVMQAAATFYTDLKYGWRAQLNFDFQVYLILVALWIFYREKNFSMKFIFSLLELIAGNLFFIPYLMYTIYNSKGDIKKILLGEHNLEKEV